jgi:hypothetical protein
MKKISEVLNNQLDIMNERKWDRIYVAVDWHDTMMPSTYSNDKYGQYLLYKDAMEVLQWMSNSANIRLILFTSSHGDQKGDFMHNVFHRYGISFDYHNGNPEVQNTDTGDFSEKFYYNVLLDDKAGFDPDVDWKDLRDHIPEFNRRISNDRDNNSNEG